MNNNNDKVLEKFTILFKNLLEHIDNLKVLAKDKEIAIKNIDKIKELGIWHLDNKQIARELIVELPKYNGNFMFNMIKNQLLEQIVDMTNLSTAYQDNIEKSIESNDIDKLEETIIELKEYAIKADKMAKKLSIFTKSVM